MAGLIQVSEAATIAIHSVLWMARQNGRLIRSNELCRLFDFSEAHFAKVMQALARAGIVNSVRGPSGGTTLAKDPNEITLLEVYQALEGPIDQKKCLLSPKVCTARCCPMGREVARVNESLRKTLSETTLASMAGSMDWSGFIARAGFRELNVESVNV